MQSEILTKLNDFIEAEIRPMLLGDGGDLQMLGVNAANYLELKVEGQCVHCASLPMTVTFGIEAKIKEMFPEIKGVIIQTANEENL